MISTHKIYERIYYRYDIFSIISTLMDTRKIKDVIAELSEVSARKSQKKVTMWLQPIDENWFYELHFSSEELALTSNLIDELHHLMEFRLSTPTFPYE